MISIAYSNCGLMQSILTNGGTTAMASSTDSESEEGGGVAKTTSVLVAKKPGKFEVCPYHKNQLLLKLF